MNCNCLDRVHEKLVGYLTEKGVVNPVVTDDFLGINFDTGDALINLVYTVRGDNRPYNTQKGKPVNMVASFCPWCGVSMKKEPTDGPKADEERGTQAGRPAGG